MSDPIMVTYVQDLGIYEIKLGRGEWLINDEKTFLNESYSPTIVTTSDIPKKINRISFIQVVDHYNYNELQNISPSAYKDCINSFLKHATETEDGLEWGGNLEAEFEYRKFIRDAKPVYVEKRVLTEVPFVVTHAIIKHKSSFVTSHYSLDGADPHLCTVRVGGIQIDELRKAAAKWDAKVEIPNYSHLEFAKLNGKYIFNKASFSSCREVKVPFSEADALEEQTRGEIRKIVQQNLEVLVESKISVGEVLSGLKYIGNTASIAERATPSKRRSLLQAITSKVKSMVETIEKEYKDEA